MAHGAAAAAAASGAPESGGDRLMEIEFEVEEIREGIQASRGSRLALLAREFPAIRPLRRRGSSEELLSQFVIHPDNRLYQLWIHFILIWAVYSSFFTPMEFGFFRGLPRNLLFLDIAGQGVFFADFIVQFLVAYRDPHTYRMVYNPSAIAIRYFRSCFVVDFLSLFPWDLIYKVCGRKEQLRYLLWIRLCRVRKVTDFFQKMEKDIRINYLFTRIVKLIAVELYCTHTAACIFYYLATTFPESKEGYTWIGSLTLGEYNYTNFREINFWRRYLTSLYFAIVTMATVGYGDIHAVNMREMVFTMIFVSFDMILGAYLIGNMTALIVKGSKTERFRDKMKDLIKYMNRNRLGKDIRDQIKGHVRLQYESSYTEASVLQDIPVSIRAKISEDLYKPYIETIHLFKGCSSEFIHQIAIRLQEEFFLPGEVILEQGNAVDQLYFVCDGILECVGIGEDGTEETVLQFERNSSFGEIAILCNIPQPFSVRVCELCRLLRLDRQSFTNILEVYFVDARTALNNVLEGSEYNTRIKQLESDITLHIERQEAELALKVNSAASHGDLNHLKSLIRAGADPKKTDYDGRSPLHLAASRGYENMVLFLIHECVDINIPDKYGNTPLLEAIKNKHDRVASLLFSKGAKLCLSDAGSQLCAAVARGDAGFMKRVLSYGADPNSKDYDHHTPLHIAAGEGLYLIAEVLLQAGASVLVEDRWGMTPLDEARKRGSSSIIKLLEDAECEELIKLPNRSRDIREKTQRYKCTVFPYHPWGPRDERREGIVIWVPRTIEELIRSAEELLECSASCILSEDGGKILDADLISDGQSLYLRVDSHSSTSSTKVN
ncbi:Potassium channel KOR1 [Apostasia shenzhenica]|uniref:Potassium channel n=1 Tax=Apostasia shenzhenica TaxID=1088818 RepID=A0A2H9ZV48_9ASPA|nr:Potassium channel KOR1 [Apostasia shenzhenica]